MSKLAAYIQNNTDYFAKIFEKLKYCFMKLVGVFSWDISSDRKIYIWVTVVIFGMIVTRYIPFSGIGWGVSGMFANRMMYKAA